MQIPEKWKDVLNENMLFALFGFSEERLRRIREKNETIHREFGYERISDAALDSSFNEQKSLIIASMMNATMSQVSMRLLQDGFTYETAPVFAVGSKAMGAYSSLVVDALGRAAEIQHDYGMTAKQTISTVGMSVVAARIAKEIRDTRRNMRLLNAARDIYTLRNIQNTALRGMARVVTLARRAILPMLIAEGLSLVGYQIARRATEGRARRLAFQEMAGRLFDRQRIVDDFYTYRGTLPGGQITGAYDRFEEILSTNIHGVPMSRFGPDYESMSNMSRQFASTAMLNNNNYDGYMAKNVQLSSIWGTDMTNTLAGLSRITVGAEIDVATKAFEEFFIAVAGGGVPQVAQISLVNELIGFTESYVQGQKLNLHGGENLARIAQYVMPAYNKHTTAPVQSLVSGLDAVLSNYMGSLTTQRLMLEAGITITEAALGVTSTKDAFEKTLLGLVNLTGIGYQSFDEDGNLSEEKLQALYYAMTTGMGADVGTVQSVIPALRRLVSGDKIEDVYTAFSQAEEEGRTRVIGDSPFTKLAEELGRGSRELSRNILDNAHIMADISDLLLDAYARMVPEIINEVGRLAITASYIHDSNLSAALGSNYPIPPSNLTGSVASARSGVASRGVALGQQIASGSALMNPGNFDRRWLYLEDHIRAFQAQMFTGMAGSSGFRVTTISDATYTDSSVYHGGIDIVIGAAGSRSPIYFPFKEGTVSFAGLRSGSTSGSYGNSVIIELGSGLAISFSHMSSIAVRVGQDLSYGDLVGYQGSTGKSTGAHVDIEFFSGEGSSRRRVSNPAALERLFKHHLPSTMPDTGSSIPRHVDTVASEGYNESIYASEGENVLHIDIDAGAYDRGGLGNFLMESMNV